KPNLVKVIKASQIRWLEHIYRYDEEHPIRRLTFQTPKEREREADEEPDGFSGEMVVGCGAKPMEEVGVEQIWMEKADGDSLGR
ncbi:hypothetical protein HHI36_015280, partial [Cryptolaemus montrouzieri]